MRKHTQTLNLDKQPVILFDGYCHLCDGTVNILLKIDRNQQLKYAALQSNYGKSLKEKNPDLAKIDSIILIENEIIHVKSDAALRIVSFLPWYFRWLNILYLIPTSLRNGIYDWIAKNRYKFLGKRKNCRVPEETEMKRFIK